MKDNDKNTHGSHAKVGDMVEILTCHGKQTGVVRLVLGVQKVFSPTFRRFDSFLYLEGFDQKVRASNVHIVGKGSGWK